MLSQAYAPIYSYGLNYFCQKGPWHIAPPKYGTLIFMSLPCSPTAPMPYQAGEPTYMLRPNISLFLLSHRSSSLPGPRENPISVLVLPLFFWHVPMQATVWKPLGYAIAQRQNFKVNVIQQKYYFNIITNSLLNSIPKLLEFQTFNNIILII